MLHSLPSFMSARTATCLWHQSYEYLLPPALPAARALTRATAASGPGPVPGPECGLAHWLPAVDAQAGPGWPISLSLPKRRG